MKRLTDLGPILPWLLDELADRVADRLGADRRRDTYRSDDLPPDCPSTRAFAVSCRTIPEATKLGRIWIVPREAWERRRLRSRGAERPTKPARTDGPSAPNEAKGLNERADALLRRSGLRVVR